jgi:hypothetical protein
MPGTPEAVEPENPRDANIPEKYRGLTIVHPAGGSPYYICPETGLMTFISPPGTPPVTTEQVLRELEDFP